MIDHFAILEQPRRLWLDADALKDAFHRLSATVHPDVAGTGDSAKFAALNGAYSVVREPASRMRHWLELTFPDAPTANPAPPPELGDLFMEIAGLRRRLDAHLAQRKAATSPLSRALLAGDEAALRRDLTAALERLEVAQSAALAELKSSDAAWQEAAPIPREALLGLSHRLAYLARWSTQLREALFALGA
jgi:curved DNA-binding protein CbpA